jgi:hypothetical protein
MFPPMSVDECADERRKLSTESIRYELQIENFVESMSKPKTGARLLCTRSYEAQPRVVGYSSSFAS